MGIINQVWGALPVQVRDKVKRVRRGGSIPVDKAARAIFKDLPPDAWGDVQFFDRLYKFHGPLRSTADLNAQTKLDAELHFHFREKAEVALDGVLVLVRRRLFRVRFRRSQHVPQHADRL